MTALRLISLFLTTLGMAGAANADPVLAGRVAGLEFGQDEATVRPILENHCGAVQPVIIEAPNFPLARHSEVHLVCTEFESPGQGIDRLTLTLADDRLVLLFAEGSTAALEALAGDPLHDWLQFAVSWNEMLVIDRAAGRAWIMSPESAHPNLFQWPNPYVASSQRIDYEASAARPAVLEFGADLETLKPLFREHCVFAAIDSYDPWLLSEPALQQQVDCFGFEYAGFPRKIEAVFGDGILQQAWILTGSGEEDRVRSALIEAYGEASYIDQDWEIFDDGRVMLRKDKPEVLMLSEELAPLYRAEYIDGSD